MGWLDILIGFPVSWDVPMATTFRTLCPSIRACLHHACVLACVFACVCTCTRGLHVCPHAHMSTCMQGYLPANIDRREETLQRKRQEYRNFIDQYYRMRSDPLHVDTFRQVGIHMYMYACMCIIHCMSSSTNQNFLLANYQLLDESRWS